MKIDTHQYERGYAIAWRMMMNGNAGDWNPRTNDSHRRGRIDAIADYRHREKYGRPWPVKLMVDTQAENG